jgi:cytochrome c556
LNYYPEQPPRWAANVGRYELRRITACLLATVSIALSASPIFASPADDVKARISQFRELGASFKTVNDSLRSPEPQTFLIQIAARQIVNSSRALPTWFPAGSGPESGEKTKAKAEIWQQPAKFKDAQNTFAVEAVAFQRTAQSGNIALIQAETRKLGMTCKGCHDNFRVPGN